MTSTDSGAASGPPYPDRGCSPYIFYPLCALAFTLPSDIQIPVGDYSLSLAELGLYLAVLFSFISPRGRPGPVRMLSGVLILLFLLSVMVTFLITQKFQITLSAARNALVLLVGVNLFDRVSLSERQLSGILTTFLIGALIAASWGIAQSQLGLKMVPSIFDMHLTPQGSRDQLLTVIRWKYGLLSAAHLARFQTTLAMGFSAFSNNFAASMAFALVVSMYFYRKHPSLRVLFGFVTGIFVLAILLSASRIPLLASCFVTIPFFILFYAGSPHRIGFVRVAFFYTLGIGAWIVLASGILGFDNFGTLSGRTSLNISGLSIALSDSTTMLFGGRAADYYSQFLQSPHNMLIYLFLQFGIIGTIPFVVLFFVVISEIISGRRTLAQRHPEFAPYADLALGASLWMIAYGLTWSVVESAPTNLNWVLLASAAVARMRALGVTAIPQPQNTWSPSGRAPRSPAADARPQADQQHPPGGSIGQAGY
jgi:hypothetical protein